MSDEEQDRDMPDANGDQESSQLKQETAQYGEVQLSSGQETIAAGVAAGNIHLQSADAATLALPEVSDKQEIVPNMLAWSKTSAMLMSVGKQRSQATAGALAASCRGATGSA